MIDNNGRVNWSTVGETGLWGMLTGGILNGVGSLLASGGSPGGGMGLAFADGGSLATAWLGVASEGATQAIAGGSLAGLNMLLSQGNGGGEGSSGGEPNGGEQGGADSFQEAIENAIQDEWAARGDLTSDSMTVTNIEGPKAVTNLDPALGPNQVRYQVSVVNEATGETLDVSVGYDPTIGQFGTIKPASGKH